MGTAYEREVGYVVLWVATGMAMFFSLMRVYVRLFMIKAYGFDDHFHILALLPLLVSTSLMTLSMSYNWGRGATTDPGDTRPPPPSYLAGPELLATLAQGILIFGSALSKAAVGLFQLRFITVRWQRWSIIFVMFALTTMSIIINIMQYGSCTPAAAFWDVELEGTCVGNFLALVFVMSLSLVLADFFFVILPWVFVRGLNMPYKEKAIVLSSMSLGILASGVGLARTVKIMTLDPEGDPDTTLLPAIYDTWEYAITLSCVCIPVCNPLWITWARKLCWRSSRKNSRSRDRHRMKQKVIPPKAAWGQPQAKKAFPGAAAGLDGTFGLGREAGDEGVWDGSQSSRLRNGRAVGDGPMYALQTIGGSDMYKDDEYMSGAFLYGSSMASSNGPSAAGSSGQNDKKDGVIDFSTGKEPRDGKRRSLSKWTAQGIKTKSKGVILGTGTEGSQHFSEIELFEREVRIDDDVDDDGDDDDDGEDEFRGTHFTSGAHTDRLNDPEPGLGWGLSPPGLGNRASKPQGET